MSFLQFRNRKKMINSISNLLKMLTASSDTGLIVYRQSELLQTKGKYVSNGSYKNEKDYSLCNYMKAQMH